MLRPSYSELMDILNNNMDLDNKVTSRYTIVIAAARRARQIVDGSPRDDGGVHTDKPVSIAVHEIASSKVFILPDGAPEEETPSVDMSAYERAYEHMTNADIDFNADDDDDDEFDDYEDDFDVADEVEEE